MEAAAQPLLFSYRRCPYAIRARLALGYAQVPVRLHEVSLRNKPPQMLAVSPKGTVPVLVLPSGQVLEQSLDIMRWALAQHDPDDWLFTQQDTANPQPSAAAEQAALWLARNDGPFKQALDGYKYPERTPGCTQLQHRAQAIEALIAPMEAQLGRTSFLLGHRMSYVDAALLPFVRQFAAVDRVWFDGEASVLFPQVAQWLAQGVASSLFESVMDKTPRPPFSPI